MILAARSPSSVQMACSSKLDITLRSITKGSFGHLGAQTADGRIAFCSSVRHDASAATLSASQPLHETCYGRVGLYAKGSQLLTAQNAFVTAPQASHLHDKLDRFVHDRHATPSSDSTIFNAVATSSGGSCPLAAAEVTAATRCQVCFSRYSAGKCRCTSARTSASVDSVMTLGMMIERGNGRCQF
jgi:hypothetical protein